MRNHVGVHILHHARDSSYEDETLTEGVEVRDLHSRGKLKATYNVDRTKPLWMVWIGRMLDTTHSGDRKACQNHVQLQISLRKNGIFKGT